MMFGHISRRQFLELAILPAAAVALPPGVRADSLSAGQYILAEKTYSNLLGPGRPTTPHWQFLTRDKRPVLRAKQGQEFRLRAINTLDEEIWLHFFGVRGPADMMTVVVPPGESNSVEVVFTPPDAGTFWFGPFLSASRQREMGLYGMLIVEDAVPVEGMVDVPLILDDWALGDDGAIDQNFGDMNAAIGQGRLGNWYTVNGQFKPEIAVPRGAPVRLRLLNAANSRGFDIQFRGADLLRVAQDGQPLKPVALEGASVHLEPGQRVDLLANKIEQGLSVGFDLEADFFEAAHLVLRGPAAAPPPAVVAFAANPLPVVDPAVTPRSVALVIEGGAGGGLQSARVGKDVLDARELVKKGLAWSVNGAAGIDAAPLFEAKPGEVLLLEVDNRTAFAQPLHIHGHVWHLLDINGAVVDGQSWRDTAVVPANAKARLVFVAATAGTWPIQSLLAERLDSGLVGAFVVADMP